MLLCHNLRELSRIYFFFARFELLGSRFIAAPIKTATPPRFMYAGGVAVAFMKYRCLSCPHQTALLIECDSIAADRGIAIVKLFGILLLFDLVQRCFTALFQVI